VHAAYDYLKAHLASGLELVMGTGRFVALRTIAVQANDGGERMFEGEHVFINTGTVASIPDELSISVQISEMQPRPTTFDDI
jgi:pyruvate/2-oxoglutarate dehydrogenase complex dihydrolipoamide dehydrogenase (E3) component